jgi:hypothetical protein
VKINCLEKAAWMNDSRKPAQSSRLSGGQGKRGPVSGSSKPPIQGGILESLLAAALSEDELVTQLLQASLRGDRSRTVKLARAIAEHCGALREHSVSAASATHGTCRVHYEDKLLAAIHREEILLESLIAASARDERPTLFRLCRELTENRKCFDPEFRRKTKLNKEPDL